MQSLLLDIRYAFRSLRRTPTVALVAIVTLALGVGANTAIFSLVNAVLLRPLPFANPEQLVAVSESANGATHRRVSGHEFAAWRDESTVFESIATYEGAGFNLTGGGEPVSVQALSITANYHHVLGVRPLLGRVFSKGDDRAGSNHVVILSEALWKRRFAGDSAVVGRSIRLNDEPYTIVGVLEARAFDPQIWVPMNVADVVQKVGKHSLSVIGRLKPGATLELAQQDLQRISRGLAERMPDFNAGHEANAITLNEEVTGEAKRPVFVVFGAVGFVLLIACANVAHLLLTRAAGRNREIAVRTALGASRGRLVAQLLTESLLLSVAGGTLGLLVATWLVDLVPLLGAANLPRMDEARVDVPVMMASAVLALAAGILSGLVPALRGTAASPGELLGEGVRASSGSARKLAGMLVISEVALALVLLVGAGLAVRSLDNLTSVQPGFDAEHVLLADVSLPDSRYPNPEHKRNGIEQMVTQLSVLPGVTSVGTTTQLPLSGADDWVLVGIDGYINENPSEETQAAWRVVNSDYFRTMRIPLKSGRVFQPTDARISIPLIRWYAQQPFPAHFKEAQAAPVAVVNETMARLYWKGVNPIGKRFTILHSPSITVIGIVGDVKHTALGKQASPEVYLSDLQEPEAWATIAIRTAGEPLALSASVRAAIRTFDRDLPVEKIRTMRDVRLQSVSGARLNAQLLGAFGALALIMAMVGIYGVISYSVAQRTHEIGIRSAIGASSRDVVRLILGRAMLLTASGVVIGSIGAFALTRVLTRMLFEVKPTDPATFISMAIALAAVALVASYIPTRRALRIDPIEALRSN